jgi:hypothetical protein
MGTESETVAAASSGTNGAIVVQGGIALGTAVVVNALVVFLAGQAEIAPTLEPLSYGPVVVFTALGTIGATVVYALLRRFVEQPDRTFTAVAGVVLVLSLIPDATYAPGLPGATTAGVAVLALMHVTAAIACLVNLTDWRT